MMRLSGVARNPANGFPAGPLARLLPRPSNSSPTALGQMLQHRLLDGIERLEPDSEGRALEEPASRRYDIIRLRYVEGIDIPIICQRLGSSRADYFRQLRQGLQTIASDLQAQVLSGSGPLPLLMSVGYQTPLVGREQELELLKTAYDSAASGEGGRVVMVSGAQGVGKTRLAQELGSYVRQEGGLFLEGRWAAWEGAAPYGALAECLRRHLRLLDPEEVAQAVAPYARDLARLFPGVVEYSDASDEDKALSTEEQQLRLYQGVGAVVHHLSQKQPLEARTETPILPKPSFSQRRLSM